MDQTQKIYHRLRPKNVIRSLFRFLPRSWRFEVYRKFVNVKPQTPPGVTFCLAETKDDLEGAFAILHDEYVRVGLMKKQESGLRVTPYHALPSTSTLVAKHNGKVVATVTIVRDSLFGFPMDRIYDISKYRKHGVRLAEISSLVVAKDYRQNSGEYLFALLKYMYMYCVNYFGVDVLLITVNPKHLEFYEALLGFKKIEKSNVSNYDFVNGAPAVGAALDLRQAYKDYAVIYGGRRPANNLFNYFTELEFASFKFPDRQYRKISDPVMTPELLKYFLSERSNVLANMSERDQTILANLYRHSAYDVVLPVAKDLSMLMRQFVRFDVRCSGRLVFSPARMVKIKVENVSLRGFLAVVSEPIRFGTRIKINIAMADFDIADIEGWPVWKSGENLYGFYVDVYSSNWADFIAYLQKDHDHFDTSDRNVA